MLLRGLSKTGRSSGGGAGLKDSGAEARGGAVEGVVAGEAVEELDAVEAGGTTTDAGAVVTSSLGGVSIVAQAPSNMNSPTPTHLFQLNRTATNEGE